MIFSTNQIDFYSETQRIQLLNKLGNKLELLKQKINFEMFRPILEEAFPRNVPDTVGRPCFDAVFMFKILILQRLYSMSDDQTEFHINDRISFMDFLDISLHTKVPDAKTIWAYRENLVEANLTEKLFGLFTKHLEEQGFIAKHGVIVDSTIVEVPRPAYSSEDKQAMKEGKEPPSRQDSPKSMSQTDLDARFTKKHNKTYYGYKNHIVVDAADKIIVSYEVTHAAEHDINVFKEMIDEIPEHTRVWGDKAYFSKEVEEILAAKNISSEILEKATRGNPLTEVQKFLNKLKSQTRARVEHVFGYFCNSMGDIRSEVIGQKRTSVIIGLTNLTYNMLRYCFLKKELAE